jgi:WD40 repeat protein
MACSSMLYCDSCGAVQQEQASYCFACGNSLKEPLLKGRYRIISPVGQGGFGAVYKAQDTLCDDRLVAIKDINLQNLKPQEIIDATDVFNREVSLLADLSHPNLPRMYDHFTDSQHWYLVIDFIKGETLEQYLDAMYSRIGKSEGLPLMEVLDIGIQLCTVLDYLHTHAPPIIFRDLKPANVMRTSDGHLYLIDFGIARHFKPGQSRDTIPLGSPGYAAPEQYGRAQTRPQADIYSLGALLHQLLTGDDPAQSPFRFTSLKQQNLPPIERLQALLSQMLEMDVNERPASVSVVKSALEQIACELKPAILSPRGTLYSTYRGHSRLVLAVAWSPDGKYIASGSFDGTLQVWRPAQEDSATSIESSDFTYRNTRKPHAWTWVLAWSPDGKHLASGNDEKTVQVWRLEDEVARMKHILTYRGHTNWVNAVAWSPDGRYLASGSDDKTVQVWCVEEADLPEVVQVYCEHSHWVNALAWSPDGKYIASAGYDTTVRVWDVTTSETVLIYRGHDYGVNALAWSPDGQYIASAGNDTTVQVWDVITGMRVLTYHGHCLAVSALAWSPDGQYIASGGKDKAVQIWRVFGGDTGGDHRPIRGRTIYTYRGHSGWVLAVAWKPTALSGMAGGGLIASAGNDKTVQVWQAV